VALFINNNNLIYNNKVKKVGSLRYLGIN